MPFNHNRFQLAIASIAAEMNAGEDIEGRVTDLAAFSNIERSDIMFAVYEAAEPLND